MIECKFNRGFLLFDKEKLTGIQKQAIDFLINEYNCEFSVNSGYIIIVGDDTLLFDFMYDLALFANTALYMTT